MSASTAPTNSSTRNKHFANNNSAHIDITKEEFSRIKDALNKEEFRKLFLDYCDEIQDPENRKLYESEIKQLEAERGVDITFISPEPGFVVKTSADGALKCFVNIAKCAEVAKPSNEACINHDTGKRGLNWSIPMAQAAPRDDMDAHGKRCVVYDVVFHPDALYLAQRSDSFHKCLVDTALDAVEREFKVKLDRTNLKFPKMQFKGVARPTVIRKLAKNPPEEATEPHPLDNIYPAKPTEHEVTPKVIPMKINTTTKPTFTIPKYTIKHRRDVDLAEYTNELDVKLGLAIPHTLIVEIELPLLSSTAECQLDVTTKSLYLLSDRPGAKYRLTLNLPYAVNDKEGKACFDTDTRRLIITLPVVQQSADKQRTMHETLLHLNREDSGVESDIRDELHSNNESPLEELSDALDEANNLEEKNEEENIDLPAKGAAAVPSPTQSTTKITSSKTFLKNSIHYQFPAKFDCNVLDNVISLVLHVHNVQPESIATIKLSNNKSIHMQFTSIGTGYYPTHYAFYLRLPEDIGIEIVSTDVEAWENNVVLNLNLADSCENLHNYLAGLDSTDLKEYIIQGKFQVAHNSRQRKKSPQLPAANLSSSLDISVERSECERAVEIEIKPCEQFESTCAANTTEDDEASQRDAQQQQSQRKHNKKQKRKNKKRRSLSESACDDIKAYQQQQLQKQQQQQQQQQIANVTKNLAKTNNNEDNFSSPERNDSLIVTNQQQQQSTTLSVAVPSSGAITGVQQRKQRSYSECRDSLVSSSAGSSILPTSFKGILKHYSRYGPRPSISDSCSSIEECSSYSCSIEAGVFNSLRFSHSFSGIPEENVSASLSESCKKTVRFNEVIKKQVFRHDSSILGQRKKNQKRRDRKQRALQRRLSEGDSADYEDNNKSAELHDDNAQYFKSKENSYHSNNNNNNHNKHNANSKKATPHDSGIDLTNGNYTNRTKATFNKSNKNQRIRLESESSDVDCHKNSMMFEMDM